MLDAVALAGELPVPRLVALFEGFNELFTH